MQMAKSESPGKGSLSFESPDGPVVVVRIGDNHAWRNFNAATMEPLALDPLPLVSAALAKEGRHAEVCFAPPEDDSRLTIMFLGENTVMANRKELIRYASALLLTAEELRARAGIADDWQTARAAWIAREAEQRRRLRDAVSSDKLAVYDTWWNACREICTLRVGGQADGALASAELSRDVLKAAADVYVNGGLLLQKSTLRREKGQAKPKSPKPPKPPKPPSAIPQEPLPTPNSASAGPIRVKRTQR
jgi:hypothetical protein